MKINYKFADETVEIEVSEEWGNVLIELDRREYNANRRETRRHTSLDNGNAGGEWLSAEDEEIATLLADEGQEKRLHRVMEHLTPKQRDLIQAVYFGGVSVSDYARKEGVSQPAISQRLDTAIKRMKKHF